MDRRDWELLDKQLQGSVPSRRNDGVPVLMVAAVFFSGMIIGSILFRAGGPANANRVEPCDGCDGM